MAISLLALKDGGVSLEFGPEDTHQVRGAIAAKFGDPGVAWHSYLASVSFGGETFTYAEEWGEHCLIPMTERGADMLRTIAAEVR
jgi:hypothetical protein